MQIAAGRRGIARVAPESGSVEYVQSMTHPTSTSTARHFGDGGPTLADVGESALLDQLIAISAALAPGRLAPTSSGDDAAVWTPPTGLDLAVSIDAVVEDVDFRRGWITPRRLGRRAFAVAVSDLAGTGADALHCVATLCARPGENYEDVLDIQRGLCEAAAASGCAVIGGDVSATDGPLVIDVCVTGSLPRGRALRRSAGRPGDAVITTGVLGRAAAGLRLLLEGGQAMSPAELSWVDAQLEPGNRLREGRQLLDRGVLCGGDLSDGLLLDVARTAAASGCAVELWAASLPVDAELRARFGPDWLELAVAGGEEFELVAAAAQPDVAGLIAEWPGHLAPPTIIGTLRQGSGVRLLDRRGGDDVEMPRSRAGHFS